VFGEILTEHFHAEWTKTSGTIGPVAIAANWPLSETSLFSGAFRGITFVLGTIRWTPRWKWFNRVEEQQPTTEQEQNSAQQAQVSHVWREGQRRSRLTEEFEIFFYTLRDHLITSKKSKINGGKRRALSSIPELIEVESFVKQNGGGGVHQIRDTIHESTRDRGFSLWSQVILELYSKYIYQKYQNCHGWLYF